MKENLKAVYWSNIEYTYDEKTEEYEQLKGGFVYAFVKAFDAREAMEMILEAFNKENMNPFNIEFVMHYDEEIQWETDEETDRMMALYENAKESNDVVFDAFYTYEDLAE